MFDDDNLCDLIFGLTKKLIISKDDVIAVYVLTRTVSKEMPNLVIPDYIDENYTHLMNNMIIVYKSNNFWKQNLQYLCLIYTEAIMQNKWYEDELNADKFFSLIKYSKGGKA